MYRATNTMHSLVSMNFPRKKGDRYTQKKTNFNFDKTGFLLINDYNNNNNNLYDRHMSSGEETLLTIELFLRKRGREQEQLFLFLCVSSNMKGKQSYSLLFRSGIDAIVVSFPSIS